MIEYDSLSLIYKIKNGHAPAQTRQMFEGCEDIHNHNTRSVSSGNFYIKKMNTAKGQTRFAYSGVMALNNLPESLKSILCVTGRLPKESEEAYTGNFWMNW